MEIVDDEKIEVKINGEKKECDVLFTYVSDETGKAYIGYTDHSKTDGKMNIYCSSYDPIFGSDKELKEITDPEELELMNEIINEITNGDSSKS